jgi:hypothetical protein
MDRGMTEHIIIEISINEKVNAKPIRERLQEMIRMNCNHCDCHSIRSWIEKRNDTK